MTTLTSLQILRAVAALGVVVHHIQLDLSTRLGFTAALPDLGFGAAGVDLFFVISGFVMVHAAAPLFGRADGPRRFFARRLIRIVPLYWAVTSLYLALAFVLPGLATSHYSPALIAASYLFFPFPRADGVMQPVVGLGWTLNYEMFFYLLFGCALFLRRAAAVAAVTGALLALMAVGWWAGPLPGALGFWADPITLEFVFGMLVALGLRAGWRLPPAAAFALMGAGLAGLALAAFVQLVPTLPRGLAWGAPAALFVAGAVFGDRRQTPGRLGRLLSALGDASYSLYLLHPFAIRLMREGAQQGFLDPAAAPWTYAALSLAVSILAALACHRLFERPVTRWLQARLARPPARPPAVPDAYPGSQAA